MGWLTTSTKKTWRAEPARKSTIRQRSRVRPASATGGPQQPAALRRWRRVVLHALRELNPKATGRRVPAQSRQSSTAPSRRDVFFMLLVAAFAGPGLAARRPRNLRRNLVLSHATSAQRSAFAWHSAQRIGHVRRADTRRHAAAGACRYDRRAHSVSLAVARLIAFAVVCDSVLGSADLSGDGAGAFTCCSYLGLHSCRRASGINPMEVLRSN